MPKMLAKANLEMNGSALTPFKRSRKAVETCRHSLAWCNSKPADQPDATLLEAATISTSYSQRAAWPGARHPLQAPVTPHASSRLMHCRQGLRAGILAKWPRRRHGRFLDCDALPRWQAASTLAMSCPCSVLPIQWTSCQLASYMRKNHSHISLSCSQLLAFSPNCYSQPTPPLQSITRLLYDYYDLALVNDCCCACPPATLVNTLTTLSLPPPTERHPR
jgi:hypothetical protein